MKWNILERNNISWEYLWLVSPFTVREHHPKHRKWNKYRLHFLTILVMLESKSKGNWKTKKLIHKYRLCHVEEKDEHSHGEVGDESRRRKVHLESSLLGDGELVPYWTLDCGNSVAGHHWTLHMVVCHLQLVTSQLHVFKILLSKMDQSKEKKASLWKKEISASVVYHEILGWIVHYFAFHGCRCLWLC